MIRAIPANLTCEGSAAFHPSAQPFQPSEHAGQLTPELLAAFSPFRTHHLNRFGLYELKDVVPMPVDYGIKFDVRA